MANYSSTKLKPVIRDYGCRNRLPHDLSMIGETKAVRVERCKICNKIVRTHLHYKGRIDNREYLETHARRFAQKDGRTKRLYYKIHEPEKLIIKI